MNIVIKNGSIFKKVINSIKDLNEVSEIKFDKNGMTIQTMDGTHVCLAYVFIPDSYFSSYNILGSLTIGVNFDAFSDILKLSKKEDIKLSYDVKNSDKLTVDISDSRTVKFEMVLINIPQDPIEMSELSFDYIVYMNTQELNKTFKDLSIFGDKCTINISEKEIFFTVSGDKGTGELGIEEFKIDKLNENAGLLKLTFNLKFLLLFSKANITEQIILKFSESSPLCCEYKFEEAVMSYYLGPMAD